MPCLDILFADKLLEALLAAQEQTEGALAEPAAMIKATMKVEFAHRHRAGFVANLTAD